MRRDEDCFPFVAEVIKQIPNLLTVNRIKTHSRLVKKQQRGIVHQRATDRQELPHPSGKALGCSVLFFLQINHAKQVLDSRFKLSARHAIRATEEPEIFRHSKIEVKAEALRDVSEFGAHLLPVLPDI